MAVLVSCFLFGEGYFDSPSWEVTLYLVLREKVAGAPKVSVPIWLLVGEDCIACWCAKCRLITGRYSRNPLGKAALRGGAG